MDKEKDYKGTDKSKEHARNTMLKYSDEAYSKMSRMREGKKEGIKKELKRLARERMRKGKGRVKYNRDVLEMKGLLGSKGEGS